MLLPLADFYAGFYNFFMGISYACTTVFPVILPEGYLLILFVFIQLRVIPRYGLSGDKIIYREIK